MSFLLVDFTNGLIGSQTGVTRVSEYRGLAGHVVKLDHSFVARVSG